MSDSSDYDDLQIDIEKIEEDAVNIKQKYYSKQEAKNNYGKGTMSRRDYYGRQMKQELNNDLNEYYDEEIEGPSSSKGKHQRTGEAKFNLKMEIEEYRPSNSASQFQNESPYRSSADSEEDEEFDRASWRVASRQNMKAPRSYSRKESFSNSQRSDSESEDDEDKPLDSKHQEEHQYATVMQKRKRARHNANERKRRDNMKKMFSELKESVPTLSGDRASRAKILTKSAQFIEHMERKIQKKFKACKDMEIKNKQLADEIGRLKLFMQASDKLKGVAHGCPEAMVSSGSLTCNSLKNGSGGPVVLDETSQGSHGSGYSYEDANNFGEASDFSESSSSGYSQDEEHHESELYTTAKGKSQRGPAATLKPPRPTQVSSSTKHKFVEDHAYGFHFNNRNERSQRKWKKQKKHMDSSSEERM